MRAVQQHAGSACETKACDQVSDVGDAPASSSLEDHGRGKVVGVIRRERAEKVGTDHPDFRREQGLQDTRFMTEMRMGGVSVELAFQPHSLFSGEPCSLHRDRQEESKERQN